MKDLVTYIRESIDDQMIDEGFFDKFKKEKDPKLLSEVIDKTLVHQTSKKENFKKYVNIFKELAAKSTGAVDLEKVVKDNSIDKENAEKITSDHMTFVRMVVDGGKIHFEAVNEQNLLILVVPGGQSQFKNWKKEGDLRLSNMLVNNAYLVDRSVAGDIFGGYRNLDTNKLKDSTMEKQQLEDLKQFSQGYR